MATMRIMGRQGDNQVTWDPAAAVDDLDAQAVIREAERLFEEARVAGAPAFVVDPVTKETRQITSFDPKAEEILVALPIAGG
jgi:hypothetical protein